MQFLQFLQQSIILDLFKLIQKTGHLIIFNLHILGQHDIKIDNKKITKPVVSPK